MPKKNEFKIEIFDVCISLRIDHPEILKKAASLYSPYISAPGKEPQVIINVHYSDPPASFQGTSIYETPAWSLSRKNGEIFFYCHGDFPTAAFFDPELKERNIEFFSRDLEGRVLFFAFIFWFVYAVSLNKGSGVWFHASGVIEGDKSFFFAGPSGCGKTTICSLRSDRQLQADSNTFVMKCSDGYKIFAHPWGKNKVKTVSREGVALERIFFLEHAKKNSIVPVSRIEALRRLTKEVLSHVFWDTRALEKSLGFSAELVEKVPCYRLGFVPDKRVWEFLEQQFQ